MPNIGPLEIGIVILVMLLVSGPKRLPELGRSLGGGMREFRASVTGSQPEIEAGGQSDAVTEESGPASETMRSRG